MRYMTQVKTRPPTFVVFASIHDALPESYSRFLVNGLRRDFKMPGCSRLRRTCIPRCGWGC